jgi:hypothetical protein
MDIEYRIACVTFLDILGFCNVVDSVYGNDPKPVKALLDRFVDRQLITDPSDGTGITIKGFAPDVASFSDSVVRIVWLPLRPARKVPGNTDYVGDHKRAALLVGREVAALRKLQWGFAVGRYESESPDHPGIFIRGGLTIGKVFYGLKQDPKYNPKSTQVFGPGMNRAVKLEQEKGFRYPVVKIDPVAIDANHELFAVSIDNGDIAAESGRHFIDSFKPESYSWLLNSFDDCRHIGAPEDYDFATLAAASTAKAQFDKLKLVIGRRLLTHASEKDVLEKYVWIAERHNRAVSQIAERFIDQTISFDECMISGT